MKKLLSFLLIAGFLISNLTVFQVNAAEINTKSSIEIEEESISKETNLISEETEQQTTQEEITVDQSVLFESTEEEIEIPGNFQTQENTLYEDAQTDNLSAEQNINKPIDLKWNPDKPGSFSFNPNNTEGSDIIVYIYKDGVRQFGHCSSSFNTHDICESDVSYAINESGDYAFRVHIVSDYNDHFHDDKGILSDYSEIFHYIKPDQKVEAPYVEWDIENTGRVILEPVDHAKSYELNISSNNFEGYWATTGTGNTEYDFSLVMEPNTLYKLRAKAYSDNINLYTHSDYSEPVEYYFVGTGGENIGNDTQSAITDNISIISSNDSEKIEFWQPTTEEEKIRYACFGKEKVEFTIPDNQPFSIEIKNAMQGEKCFEVFQNVAGDYVIARTYNIYPAGVQLQYETPDKITVSLTIPETLRHKDREFKMICVSRNGVPYIYNDQDKDPDTITFSTDKFYAFALVYKDK